MRKKASTDSSVVVLMKKNQKLWVLNEVRAGGVTWYRISAEIGGKTQTGYSVASYIRLDSGAGAYGQPYGGALKLRSKANAKSVYVTKANGNVLTIPEGSLVSIESETTVSGEKWFRVSAEVDGKTYTGYTPASKLALAAKPAPDPTPSPSPSPTPTPTVKPTPTEKPSPTPTKKPDPTKAPEPTEEIPAPTAGATEVPTPAPTPTPVPTVIGKGTIEGVTALALKREPKYGAKLVRNENGYSVVVTDKSEFQILEYISDAEMLWCHVSFTEEGVEYSGYINAEYVKVLDTGEIWGDKEPTPTPMPTQPDNADDFEQQLASQNFPESYLPGLRLLHELHPDWQFVANHTGLDWESVIDNESVAGKNLIPNTKGNEWKSFEANAYNWKTDSFIVYDGSTWVTASREAISYYMDPRNFLDEKNIFQFELLTYEPSYQTLEGVESILKNTALSNTAVKFKDTDGQEKEMTYGEIFMAAAEYSGVSPFHLASRVKQEVVIGTTSLSNSVTGTVAGFEGLYNFYNIGAYHSTVAGGAIANGLKYARNGSTNAALNTSMLIPWINPYRSILGGAYYIGYSYISRGQNTIYLQKFNVTPTSTYSHQYMANVEAPYSEGRKVAAAYAEFGDLPLVFSIPVYLNMPEEACGQPQTAWNPNNWLKTLKVSDAEGNDLVLTPTFDMTAEQEYDLVLDSGCDLIQVEAQAVSKKASVEGATWYTIGEGSSTVVVSVTAENGDIREYIINIARQ